MALDARSGHAAEKMTLLDCLGRRPTAPISLRSLGLAQDPIPQQASEIAPSPSPPSDTSDSRVEDMVVCAPTVHNLRLRRQQSHAKGCVTFDEVFQDGNAAVKHFIVQIPSPDGLWYILHCDEHRLAFQHPALRGAAAHLKGRKHGLPWYPTNLEVVKHFGVEVVDCDAELAEKNNSIALAVSQAGKTPSFECSADRKQSPKKRPHESNETEIKGKEVTRRHSKQQRLSSGIARPIPGRIYLAYWETAKGWLPALVLPHKGLEAFGIPSTLEKLGLMNNTPACLRCEPDTQNLKWREGYEHDGPRAMDREFPVLFFDRRDFPEGASAGWVKAGDLQELRAFHTSSRLVPNMKFVKKYLWKRLQPEAGFVDDISCASSGEHEGCESDRPSIRATDNESPPRSTLTSAHFEPDQPGTDVLKGNPQIEEAPLPPNSESEAPFLASMPLSPGQSHPGTSSKSQVESAPINTQSITDDMTMISIFSAEDETVGKGQPDASIQLPTADDRIDPRHSVVTAEKDAGQNNSIAPRHNYSLQLTTAPSISLTSDTVQDSVVPAPPRNEQVNPRIQIPTPIHVYHTQHNLPNHAAIDLRNLMTRSTYMGFPEALPGSEAPQSELPPIQPPTSRRPLKLPNPQGPSASGFHHHHQLPPSSNSPVTSSQPRTSHVSPARPTVSAETRPLQPTAPSTPSHPPPGSRAYAPAIPILPAPKPNLYQEPMTTGNPAPPPTSHPAVSISWRPVYVGKALQLDTVNPQFGIPPNEVPLPFLDRLKKLVGRWDNFPKMAKFLDGNGFYFCPWCEKRYRRAVMFTDHLVLNHSR